MSDDRDLSYMQRAIDAEAVVGKLVRAAKRNDRENLADLGVALLRIAALEATLRVTVAFYDGIDAPHRDGEAAILDQLAAQIAGIADPTVAFGKVGQFPNQEELLCAKTAAIQRLIDNRCGMGVSAETAREIVEMVLRETA